LAGGGINCIRWVIARGWIGHRVGDGGVRIIIGKIAVAGGLEGGDFRLGSGGGSVTANSASCTEGKTCQDADDCDNGKELDQGKRMRGTIFVLVEMWKCGCSHHYDLNFISEISKVKKQLVHFGGVAGGDLDYRASRRLGLASDQWRDQGGQEGGSGFDGGIDQDSCECVLCGVFSVSCKHEWDDGYQLFKSDEHNRYEWGKLSRDRLFGGATKVYQFRWIGNPQRISFRWKTDQLFRFNR